MVLVNGDMRITPKRKSEKGEEGRKKQSALPRGVVVKHTWTGELAL